MYDIVLLHPPPNLLPEPYPVFPMPWCPEFIGSTDDLDHFPMPERFTAMPAGLYGLKSRLLAEGRRAEVLNLAQMSRRVYAQVRAHLQPISGPVDSMLKAWEEAYGAVKALIQRFPARLYGIDLQWLVYAAGFRELARMIKQIHPEGSIVAGGITAGLYAEELLSRVPELDFVIRGEAYGALPALYGAILQGEGYGKVDGLVYRARGGTASTALPASCVPEANQIQDALCDAAMHSSVVFLRSECPMDCSTCGGRKQRDREEKSTVGELSSLQDQILSAGHQTNGLGEEIRYVYLVHDPVHALGVERFVTLLRRLAEAGLTRPLAVEFYTPPPQQVVSVLEETFPVSTLAISPESASEVLRKAQRGHTYSNDMLEEFIRSVKASEGLSLKCWFMGGIPWDTTDTMKRTAGYISDLYHRIAEATDRIHLLYTPLAQIDPGSPAFTQPQRFGYRLIWTRFSEAVSNMRHPHPLSRWNFSPVHEESPYSFFRNLLDVLDLMNRVYAAHGLYSEAWTRRASRYNGLLREFWEPYLRLETVDSAYERRKAFLRLGQEFMESYYE